MGRSVERRSASFALPGKLPPQHELLTRRGVYSLTESVVFPRRCAPEAMGIVLEQGEKGIWPESTSPDDFPAHNLLLPLSFVALMDHVLVVLW